MEVQASRRKKRNKAAHKKDSRASMRVNPVAQAALLLALLAVLSYVVHLNILVAPVGGTSLAGVPEEKTLPAMGESAAENVFSARQDSPEAGSASAPDSEPEPAPTPLPDFFPAAADATLPEKLIRSTGVQVDGVVLSGGQEYSPKETIDFSVGEEYTGVDGIITFRGDNFRSGASRGFAGMEAFRFGESWVVPTGTTSYNGEDWSGSGWVGQPLIVRWPQETRAVMNLYDEAKADENLVEVIYATMDGNVYFLNLETGEATRDPLRLGYTFKGAGALDPRGYPLMYLGSGYDSAKGRSRVFVISLIDGKVLYTFGNGDSFALRQVSYFDGSALVDAETDTLIYPGENGLLYLIHLNTDYNEAEGTLTVDPDRVVKWRYNGVRTNVSSYWLGMESSPVIWRGHIIMADNGGNLMCLDLNTLTLDWVQDTLDDTNCSPVLSLEDGHPYIYISTSFHMGWRSSTTAVIPVWKIDAETGETVWQTDYTCHTESGVSGGVQSTAGLGRLGLEGYVYVTVAKTDAVNHGKLVCLDAATGDTVWEHEAYYTWSSPVPVYNEDGSGYVVYCTMGGTMFLLDGLTGEVLDQFDLQGGVEASPAVYGSWVIIGTRLCRIWGVKLT